MERDGTMRQTFT